MLSRSPVNKKNKLGSSPKKYYKRDIKNENISCKEEKNGDKKWEDTNSIFGKSKNKEKNMMLKNIIISKNSIKNKICKSKSFIVKKEMNSKFASLKKNKRKINLNKLSILSIKSKITKISSLLKKNENKVNMINEEHTKNKNQLSRNKIVNSYKLLYDIESMRKNKKDLILIKNENNSKERNSVLIKSIIHKYYSEDRDIKKKNINDHIGNNNNNDDDGDGDGDGDDDGDDGDCSDNNHNNHCNNNHCSYNNNYVYYYPFKRHTSYNSLPCNIKEQETKENEDQFDSHNIQKYNIHKKYTSLTRSNEPYKNNIMIKKCNSLVLPTLNNKNEIHKNEIHKNEIHKNEIYKNEIHKNEIHKNGIHKNEIHKNDCSNDIQKYNHLYNSYDNHIKLCNLNEDNNLSSHIEDIKRTKENISNNYITYKKYVLQKGSDRISHNEEVKNDKNYIMNLNDYSKEYHNKITNEGAVTNFSFNVATMENEKSVSKNMGHTTNGMNDMINVNNMNNMNYMNNINDMSNMNYMNNINDINDMPNINNVNTYYHRANTQKISKNKLYHDQEVEEDIINNDRRHDDLEESLSHLSDSFNLEYLPAIPDDINLISSNDNFFSVYGKSIKSSSFSNDFHKDQNKDPYCQDNIKQYNEEHLYESLRSKDSRDIQNSNNIGLHKSKYYDDDDDLIISMFHDDQENQNIKEDKHSNDHSEEALNENIRNMDIIETKMNSINKLQGVVKDLDNINNMKTFYSMDHKTNKKLNLSDYFENDENVSKQMKIEERNMNNTNSTNNIKNIKNINNINNINNMNDSDIYYDHEKNNSLLYNVKETYAQKSQKYTSDVEEKKKNTKNNIRRGLYLASKILKEIHEEKQKKKKIKKKENFYNYLDKNKYDNNYIHNETYNNTYSNTIPELYEIKKNKNILSSSYDDFYLNFKKKKNNINKNNNILCDINYENSDIMPSPINNNYVDKNYVNKNYVNKNYVDNEFLNLSGKNNILEYSLNSLKGYNYNHNYNYDDDDDSSIIHVDSMDDLKTSYESVSLLNNYSYSLDNSKCIDLNNAPNIYKRLDKQNDNNLNEEEREISISLNEQNYNISEEQKDNTIIFDINDDTTTKNININNININNDDDNNNNNNNINDDNIKTQGDYDKYSNEHIEKENNFNIKYLYSSSSIYSNTSECSNKNYMKEKKNIHLLNKSINDDYYVDYLPYEFNKIIIKKNNNSIKEKKENINNKNNNNKSIYKNQNIYINLSDGDIQINKNKKHREKEFYKKYKQNNIKKKKSNSNKKSKIKKENDISNVTKDIINIINTKCEIMEKNDYSKKINNNIDSNENKNKSNDENKHKSNDENKHKSNDENKHKSNDENKNKSNDEKEEHEEEYEIMHNVDDNKNNDHLLNDNNVNITDEPIEEKDIYYDNSNGIGNKNIVKNRMSNSMNNMYDLKHKNYYKDENVLDNDMLKDLRHVSFENINFKDKKKIYLNENILKKKKKKNLDDTYNNLLKNKSSEQNNTIGKNLSTKEFKLTYEHVENENEICISNSNSTLCEDINKQNKLSIDNSIKNDTRKLEELLKNILYTLKNDKREKNIINKINNNNIQDDHNILCDSKNIYDHDVLSNLNILDNQHINENVYNIEPQECIEEKDISMLNRKDSDDIQEEIKNDDMSNRFAILEYISHCIEILKEERDNIKQERDDIKQERDDIKEECDNIKKERDDIKKERDDIKKERDNIKEESDNIKKQNDTLTNKCNDIQNEYDNIKQERDDIKKQNDTLTNKCNDIQNEYDNIKKQNDTLTNKCNDIQNEYDNIKQERDDIKKQNDTLTNKCNDIQNEYDNIKQERDDIKKHNDTLTNKCNDIQNEYDNIKQERDYIQNEYDNIKKQNDTLTNKCNDIQNEYDNIKKQNDTLTNKCNELQNKFYNNIIDLQNITEKYDNLQNKYNILKELNDSLEDKNEELKKYHEQVIQERDQLIKEKESNKQEIEYLKNNVDVLNIDKSNYMIEQNDNINKIKKLNEEKKKLEEEKNILEEEKNILNEEKNILEEEKKILNEEKKILNEEKNILNEKINNKNDILIHKEENILYEKNKRQEEIKEKEKLQNELYIIKKEYDDLLNKYNENINEEINNMKNILIKKEEEIKEIKQNKIVLKKDIDMYVNNIHVLEIEMNKIKEENDLIKIKNLELLEKENINNIYLSKDHNKDIEMTSSLNKTQTCYNDNMNEYLYLNVDKNILKNIFDNNTNMFNDSWNVFMENKNDKLISIQENHNMNEKNNENKNDIVNSYNDHNNKCELKNELNCNFLWTHYEKILKDINHISIDKLKIQYKDLLKEYIFLELLVIEYEKNNVVLHETNKERNKEIKEMINYKNMYLELEKSNQELYDKLNEINNVLHIRDHNNEDNNGIKKDIDNDDDNKNKICNRKSSSIYIEILNKTYNITKNIDIINEEIFNMKEQKNDNNIKLSNILIYLNMISTDIMFIHTNISYINEYIMNSTIYLDIHHLKNTLLFNISTNENINMNISSTLCKDPNEIKRYDNKIKTGNHNIYMGGMHDMDHIDNDLKMCDEELFKENELINIKNKNINPNNDVNNNNAEYNYNDNIKNENIPITDMKIKNKRDNITNNIINKSYDDHIEDVLTFFEVSFSSDLFLLLCHMCKSINEINCSLRKNDINSCNNNLIYIKNVLHDINNFYNNEENTSFLDVYVHLFDIFKKSVDKMLNIIQAEKDSDKIYKMFVEVYYMKKIIRFIIFSFFKFHDIYSIFHINKLDGASNCVGPITCKDDEKKVQNYDEDKNINMEEKKKKMGKHIHIDDNKIIINSDISHVCNEINKYYYNYWDEYHTSDERERNVYYHHMNKKKKKKEKHIDINKKDEIDINEKEGNILYSLMLKILEYNYNSHIIPNIICTYEDKKNILNNDNKILLFDEKINYAKYVFKIIYEHMELGNFIINSNEFLNTFEEKSLKNYLYNNIFFKKNYNINIDIIHQYLSMLFKQNIGINYEYYYEQFLLILNKMILNISSNNNIHHLNTTSCENIFFFDNLNIEENYINECIHASSLTDLQHKNKNKSINNINKNKSINNINKNKSINNINKNKIHNISHNNNATQLRSLSFNTTTSNKTFTTIKHENPINHNTNYIINYPLLDIDNKYMSVLFHMWQKMELNFFSKQYYYQSNKYKETKEKKKNILSKSCTYNINNKRLKKNIWGTINIKDSTTKKKMYHHDDDNMDSQNEKKYNMNKDTNNNQNDLYDNIINDDVSNNNSFNNFNFDNKLNEQNDTEKKKKKKKSLKYFNKFSSLNKMNTFNYETDLTSNDYSIDTYLKLMVFDIFKCNNEKKEIGIDDFIFVFKQLHINIKKNVINTIWCILTAKQNLNTALKEKITISTFIKKAYTTNPSLIFFEYCKNKVQLKEANKNIKLLQKYNKKMLLLVTN
ncbi:conserved Plasmodium protein, unknown function [Plasmodium gaboni]|uniref:Uncharacterized protein n=1 Tax=Plasmodium gaboni TaxID=647221 RepID=A0ABY1URT4_9APIC|nr:conserved Plasmodium protein, unknown function [Plasmodium gaboni]